MTDRAEWLEWRRKGLGASEVAAVLGLSPWASPYSVWADKVGYPVYTVDNDRLEFGRRAEPMVAEWFTDRTGLYVCGEQTWCAHPAHPWMRATVDGFVADSPFSHASASELRDHAADFTAVLGVLEIKTTSAGEWDAIPVHYQCQGQWQMAVTGLPRVWFAVLHLSAGHPRFAVYELERDDDDIALLIERCDLFWRLHVGTGLSPGTDAHPATTAALKDAWEPTERTTLELDVMAPVVDEWRRLRDRSREVERELTAVENELKAALKDATDGTVDGQLVVSWRPQESRRLEVARLRADLPEIADKYETVTVTRVLRPHTPKVRT